MKLGLRESWCGEIARVLIAIPMVMVGVALPLDFIRRIDAYLKYLSVLELASVYAWGWAFFFLIGLVLALMTILPVIGLACCFDWYSEERLRRFGACLSLSIVVIVLLRATKLWLDSSEWGSVSWIGRFKWEIALAGVAGSVVWIWRRERVPKGLSGLANLVAAVGFGIGVAVYAGFFVFSAQQQGGVPTSSKNSQLSKRLPNIVLLTMDTLSADHMHLYGYKRPTTPNLEVLADVASTFERFYANSNFTTPAVNSLLHGVRPWTHRANQLESRVRMETARLGLVARLKDAGYYTLGVATNAVAAPSYTRSAPWFDKNVEGRVNTWIPNFLVTEIFARAAMTMDIVELSFTWLDRFLSRLGVHPGNDHYDPELAFMSARELIQNREMQSPIFLWVHLLPPHHPYATPEPFMGKFDASATARTRMDSAPPAHFRAALDQTFPARLVGRYDESIAYVDHYVGRFIEWLKKEGLFENSLIVVSADHGESFTKGYGGHTGPLLHDALIRIPLIIKEPAQRIPRRLNVLGEQIDLMPTILDIAGIPILDEVEGRSLKPAIRGKEVSGAIFSMNFEQSSRFEVLDTGTVAMIEGRWKYVHYMGHIRYPLMPRLVDALYDLENDPDENENLAAAKPVTAAKMLAEIQARLHRHGSRVE